MSEHTRQSTRGALREWRTIARHDFEGSDELAVTLAAALGDGDDRWGGPPLYRTVDIEPAERFLSSAGDDDASVVFSISDRTIRVSADGAIEVRRNRPEP